jgi:serine/threonine-protein kinase
MDAHPWSTPVDKFMGLAVASGLLSVENLRTAIDAIHLRSGTGMVPDLNDVTEYFVRQGLLTRWQCGKLLDGRHKGFFLDQYKFLEWISDQGGFSKYLVEDCAKQQRAILALRRDETKPHGIEYHVVVDPASE